jgi:hypothetical protein
MAAKAHILCPATLIAFSSLTSVSAEADFSGHGGV